MTAIINKINLRTKHIRYNFLSMFCGVDHIDFQLQLHKGQARDKSWRDVNQFIKPTFGQSS